MPIHPIDLQPLLMQQQTVSADRAAAHEQPVAQQRQVAEQGKEQTREDEKKVLHAQQAETMTISDRPEHRQPPPGREGGEQAATGEKSEPAPPVESPEAAFKGLHIDVRQ